MQTMFATTKQAISPASSPSVDDNSTTYGDEPSNQLDEVGSGGASQREIQAIKSQADEETSREMQELSRSSASPSPSDLRNSAASELGAVAEGANNAMLQFQLESEAHGKQQNYLLNSQQQHLQRQSNGTELDEVKHVDLFGVQIVALTINSKQRLCLAQISNTLLKGFSYNEIHNRRVALGITCVQCTPIQLELLRRAGAMPSSSRRCGMITLREAERLCRSFLVEEQPPELPENFYFTVAHRVNYGCRGRFIPARYISSRAKCIECYYCGDFYSPNKFIFHSHRQPNSTDCNPPDSPNINSWRKHVDLDWTIEQTQEIRYAWEDVKSLFNGGTRRRMPISAAGGGGGGGGGPATGSSGRPAEKDTAACDSKPDSDEQLIDVELFDETAATKSVKTERLQRNAVGAPASGGAAQRQRCKTSPNGSNWPGQQTNRPFGGTDNTCNKQQPLDAKPVQHQIGASHSTAASKQHATSGRHAPPQKKLALERPATVQKANKYSSSQAAGLQTNAGYDFAAIRSASDLQATISANTINASRNLHWPSQAQPVPLSGLRSGQAAQSLLVSDLIANNQRRRVAQHHPPHQIVDGPTGSDRPQLVHSFQGYQAANQQEQANNSQSTNFIYSQLYAQLMQPAQQPHVYSRQAVAAVSPSTMSATQTLDTQLASRHLFWSSLLANLRTSNTLAMVSPSASGPHQAFAGVSVSPAPSNLAAACGETAPAGGGGSGASVDAQQQLNSSPFGLSAAAAMPPHLFASPQAAAVAAAMFNSQDNSCK